MNCPFCNSDDIGIPEVHNDVGMQQCGPAMCNTCCSYQDSEGEWHKTELVYCHACSVSGGAGMPIYHEAPPCKEVPV